MTEPDPVVKEPLTEEPIAKRILDAANDPVAEAERALEEALIRLIGCAVIASDEQPGRPSGIVTAARDSCLALARRYAAERALAVRDETIVVVVEDLAAEDGNWPRTKAHRELLEKETADA